MEPARSTVFFFRDFCSRFDASNEKFSKGDRWVGEVSKFMTPDGGLRKKTQKIVCVFCKSTLILRSFKVKFRFERPVLSSAKRAHSKHTKNRKVQAQLLDVLSNDIMRKAKKRI